MIMRVIFSVCVCVFVCQCFLGTDVFFFTEDKSNLKLPQITQDFFVIERSIGTMRDSFQLALDEK
jgi:hypothetical protein